MKEEEASSSSFVVFAVDFFLLSKLASETSTFAAHNAFVHFSIFFRVFLLASLFFFFLLLRKASFFFYLSRFLFSLFSSRSEASFEHLCAPLERAKELARSRESQEKRKGTNALPRVVFLGAKSIVPPHLSMFKSSSAPNLRSLGGAGGGSSATPSCSSTPRATAVVS